MEGQCARDVEQPHAGECSGSGVGRRTGQARFAILGYIEDGRNLVTPAMNGWAEPEPAWWLNLQSQPEATVELPNGMRKVGPSRDRR